jgi:tripartite-type tricarboxylate transporter receptor subunit TctC
MFGFFIKFFVILISTISIAGARTTIELVVPFAPGGTGSQIAQIVVDSLSPNFEQNNYSLVLVHKVGVGGMLGTAYVAQTPKNQIRLLVTSSGMVTAKIINQAGPAYNLEKDFFALGYLGRSPTVVLVNSKSKYQTVEQLKTACQTSHITYGSAGVGTVTHISTLDFLKNLGCNLDNVTHIPFSGSAPTLASLIGGHIDLMTDFLSSSSSHIQSGRLKPIVVLKNEKLKSLPSVPTYKTVIGKDYKLHNWFLIASNSTSNKEIDLIRAIIQQGLAREDVQKKLNQVGLVNPNEKIDQSFLKDQTDLVNHLIKVSDVK